MRICSPQLGVSPTATRGGEVFDRELLRALAALGVEVEVLLPAGLPHPAVAGWSVARLPLRRGYRWWLSNLLFVPAIGRAHRRRPFDLLRVHSLRFTGLAAVWARRIYRLAVPIVAHVHHLEADRWSEPIDRRAAAGADLLLTESAFARRQLVELLGVPEHKVEVVPCGATTADTVAAAGAEVSAAGARGTASWTVEAGGDTGGPLLLHVGSLLPRKRLEVAIEALARLRATFPGARLELIGQGPARHELRRRAESLGVAEAVRFAGAVDEREKLAALRAADVFVAPSALEGFGLAVAEAMAVGLPVVAARAAALVETLGDGEAGVLVDAGDEAAFAPRFAAAVGALLADPERRQRLAEAGRRRARERFRWDLAAQRTLELYERARRDRR
jgi:glycosyltransferase involved in cell wall biosynthesis